MHQRSSRNHVFETLLFSLASLVLYHTVVGIPLFLVPLQIVATRRGVRSLATAVGAFFTMFVVIRFWPTIFSSTHALPDVLGAIEIGVVGVLLLGMIVMNVPLRRRPRQMVMILAATALAGAISLPAMAWISSMPAFQQSMDASLGEFSRMLSSLPAPVADARLAAVISLMSHPAQLRSLLEATLLRSMLAYYAIMLTFSWWAGQASANRGRALAGLPPVFQFSRFRMDAGWLWPMIAAGGLVLADLFFGISVWAYAAWNIGLVLLFLFGLQGMAIVRFLFEKHGVPRFFWFMLVAALVVIARQSDAGLFVVLVIPVLGISENWIRYRIPREAAPTEQERR
jgi:hypothetical protein